MNLYERYVEWASEKIGKTIASALLFGGISDYRNLQTTSTIR